MLMKKSLIALAVAGAMTAPMVAQADATLYGSFRMGLVGADGADLDLRDESTRIGIKGDVDLGMESTKGLFQWEANVATTDNDGDMFKARLALMGLTGNWGTALVGRQYHPHYTMVNSHTNIFQSAKADTGEALALGNQWHKRTDNTLAYASPVMGGFQVVAGAVIAGDGSDDNNNFDDDVDGYNIGAQFTGVEGLRVSASYGKVDTNVDTSTTQLQADLTTGVVKPVTTASSADYESEIWGLGATYQIADLTLAAKYEEREDTVGAASEEFTVWELAAKYQIGATALKARYGNIEADGQKVLNGTNTDGDQWMIEVEQKLGSRGYAWVSYTDFDEEAAAIASDLHGKHVAEDLWMIGYRLDF
jgi:predicted porin